MCYNSYRVRVITTHKKIRKGRHSKVKHTYDCDNLHEMKETNTVSRKEYIAAVSTQLGVSKAEAERVLNGVEHVQHNMLVDGRDIRIGGVGTLKNVVRAAREGRNPKNPTETINIPAKKSIVLKVTKPLKEELNK